eukprot:NODE_459_length_7203_cov_0.898226.p6 type:complete len:152 gc:universal NODE_459_length_7203_cov_0.898226:2792-2337(-)
MIFLVPFTILASPADSNPAVMGPSTMDDFGNCVIQQTISCKTQSDESKCQRDGLFYCVGDSLTRDTSKIKVPADSDADKSDLKNCIDESKKSCSDSDCQVKKVIDCAMKHSTTVIDRAPTNSSSGNSTSPDASSGSIASLSIFSIYFHLLF